MLTCTIPLSDRRGGFTVYPGSHRAIESWFRDGTGAGVDEGGGAAGAVSGAFSHNANIAAVATLGDKVHVNLSMKRRSSVGIADGV